MEDFDEKLLDNIIDSLDPTELEGLSKEDIKQKSKLLIKKYREQEQLAETMEKVLQFDSDDKKYINKKYLKSVLEKLAKLK